MIPLVWQAEFDDINAIEVGSDDENSAVPKKDGWIWVRAKDQQEQA